MFKTIRGSVLVGAVSALIVGLAAIFYFYGWFTERQARMWGS
jgi:hypothetical protein